MTGRRFAAAALLGGALIAAGGAEAALIRLVDDDGVVIYTDNPWQFDAYRRQLGRDVAPPAQPPGPISASIPEAPTPRAPGAARKPKAESPAEELFRLAGLDAQVEILSSLAQDDFERLPGRFWRTDAMRDRVASIFSPDRLRAEILAGLQRRLDPDRTRAMLAWLKSPLGRQMVKIESTPPSPDRAIQEAAYVDQLPATPPPTARLALVHRAERATDATETTAVIMSATIDALRRAVSPVPGATAPDGAADLEVMGQGVDEILRFRTVTAFLFMYRELSDADLARYVAFLESPTGRWFTGISRAAILDSFHPRPAATTTAKP